MFVLKLKETVLCSIVLFLLAEDPARRLGLESLWLEQAFVLKPAGGHSCLLPLVRNFFSDFFPLIQPFQGNSVVFSDPETIRYSVFICFIKDPSHIYLRSLAYTRHSLI